MITRRVFAPSQRFAFGVKNVSSVTDTDKQTGNPFGEGAKNKSSESSMPENDWTRSQKEASRVSGEAQESTGFNQGQGFSGSSQREESASLNQGKGNTMSNQDSGSQKTSVEGAKGNTNADRQTHTGYGNTSEATRNKNDQGMAYFHQESEGVLGDTQQRKKSSDEQYSDKKTDFNQSQSMGKEKQEETDSSQFSKRQSGQALPLKTEDAKKTASNQYSKDSKESLKKEGAQDSYTSKQNQSTFEQGSSQESEKARQDNDKQASRDKTSSGSNTSRR